MGWAWRERDPTGAAQQEKGSRGEVSPSAHPGGRTVPVAREGVNGCAGTTHSWLRKKLATGAKVAQRSRDTGIPSLSKRKS